jgi:hypothetical protein
MTDAPRLVVVVPIGPRCRPEFVADTLESVDHYSVPDRRLILLDDSGRGTGCAFVDRPLTEVIAMPSHGLVGGLYLSLSAGFAAALREPFDVLLRLDTDGLVAHSGYEVRAARYFDEHPRTACLGSYRTSYDGATRSFAPPRRQLRRFVVRAAVRRPSDAARVLWLVGRALRHGYDPGESVLGGVCLYSQAGLAALSRAGLLGDQVLARTGLEEDHLFGLCLRSLGFELAGFGNRDDDLPMGVRWIGLPASPEELIAKRKALIHSARSWNDLDEAAIREVFARRRRTTAGLLEA